jgi:predicted SprT family Zn-dependent metalloprotease
VSDRPLILNFVATGNHFATLGVTGGPKLSDDDALAYLRDHYRHANRTKFEGLLPNDYRIRWNPLLRRLTGRITYRDRLIEISTFHYREYGLDDALATLEHEMLHLYLHRRGLPSGHNALFKREALARGIRVFHNNHYPRNQAPRDRYLYECPVCRRMVFRQRRRERNPLACGICCRSEADGAWDPRFALRLVAKVRFA